MTAGRIKQKAAASRRKTERRILRTRDTLGDALIALMQERNFEEITVQDVLDRAGVGRSTFYVHYRDKDDLFLSDVEDFLERVSTALTRQGASPKRLLPVQEFFAHIRESRQFYAVLVKSGKINDVQALARGLHARSMRDYKWRAWRSSQYECLPMPTLWREVFSHCSTGGWTKE